MTIRFDSSSLISGKRILSRYPGFGIPGDAIEAGSGEVLASFVLASLSMPADAAKEYRFVITSLPAAGTVVVGEDLTLIYTPGADGTYFLIGDLWEYDPATGVEQNLGELTVTFSVGETPLGLVTETDTALAMAGLQGLTLGLVTETDTALAMAGLQGLTLGLVTETDTALAMAGLQGLTLGLVTETDTALAMAGLQGLTLGLVTETEDALPMGVSQPNVIGLAIETDLAQSVSPFQPGALGLVTETDSAGSVGVLHTSALTLALEINFAQPFGLLQGYQLGLATETDTTFPFGLIQPQVLGQASETDTALSLIGGVITPEYPLCLTVEISAEMVLHVRTGNPVSTIDVLIQPDTRFKPRVLSC